MTDKFVKNSLVCLRLGVSDYQRRQMIAEGILEKPIFYGGTYPRHTEQQIIRAERLIAERAANAMQRGGSIRPLSQKQIDRVRGNNSLLLKIPN